MKKNKNITTFDELLDNKYGIRGEKDREKWEQEFEAFRLGVLLEKARKKLGITQQELADRWGQINPIFHELKTMQVISDYQL